MKEMSHDSFLEELAELAPPLAGGPASLAALLSPEAALHAERCEDCARTAGALFLMAVEEDSLFDEPPADYWDGFSARLSARLAIAPRPASASPRVGIGLSQLLRVAALLIVVAGLLAFVLRDGAEPAGTPSPRRAGVEDPLPLEQNAADFEELFAAWSDEDSWDPEDAAADRAFAALGSEETLPALLHSPTDTLHDELSRELDDAQAAELARRLRAEISS